MSAVSGDVGDPVEVLRGRLAELFTEVRRPTYRSLAAHAERDGRVLRPSTVSSLLNGPAVPRWDTVETFVRACGRYAQARQIPVAGDLVNLDRWRDSYRWMENALAGLAAQREHIAGHPVSPRRQRLAVPAQLPATTAGFTGRAGQLAELDGLLPGPEPGDRVGQPLAVVITAIDGTAGVGKTALAVHWAHRVAHLFPDGQLYVNLRGFDTGDPLDPIVAVRGFLDALDVPAQRIPAAADAQTALYRSLLAGRRILIVLDNARDSAQVAPLLPGAPGCLVVVTSRNRLTGLTAAHAAHRLCLDLLLFEDARDLLARRLGEGRVRAEPDSVRRIITRCARLPLALALVAAHAANSQHLPLAVLAAQLEDRAERLDVLTGHDDPRADASVVFSWSYQALSPQTARLFRLLGLHPGADISTAALASLAAQPLDQTRRMVSELIRANLVTEHHPGRYTMHDLLRDYATHLAHAIEPDETGRAATTRLLDHYTHTAYTAARLIDPLEDPPAVRLEQPTPTAPEALTDRAQSVAWLTTESNVLIAVLRHAIENGFDTHACYLAWGLRLFLNRQGQARELADVGYATLQAARRLHNRSAEALAHRIIARAHTMLSCHTDAEEHLSHALHLYAGAGDAAGRGWSHYDRALNAEEGGDLHRALQEATQALAAFQEAGHPRGTATALNAVGWYHTLFGDHETALDYCRRAMALQTDGDHYLAGTLGSLARAHRHLGQYTEATDCYQRAIVLYREFGDRHMQGILLDRLGDTHHTADNTAAARTAWKQALTILASLDHPQADAVQAKLDADLTAGTH